MSPIASARTSRVVRGIALGILVAACQATPAPTPSWSAPGPSGLAIATPKPTSGPSARPSAAPPEPTPTPSATPNVPTRPGVNPPWAPFPSLIQARMEHSATALPDGRIVVAGGFQRLRDANGEEYSEALASVEIFSPQDGGWELGPPMHVAHGDHLAILLADGRILVFGGGQVTRGDVFEAVDSAELFDPTTNGWSTTTAPAGRPLVRAPILLSDGRVLSINQFGSYPRSRLRPEIYDPETGTWTRGARVPEMRIFPAIAALPDGTILLAGGAYDVPDGPPSPSSDSWRYDPATDAWSATGPLATETFDGRMFVQPDGRVLLVRASFVQRFDPATNQWTNVTTSGAQGDGDHVIELLDGRILVGGSSHCSEASEQAAIYDPTTSTWLAAGAIEVGAYSTMALLPLGNVVSLGGGWGCSGPDAFYGPYPAAIVLDPSEIR